MDSTGQAELKRLEIEKEIKLRQLELEIDSLKLENLNENSIMKESLKLWN